MIGTWFDLKRFVGAAVLFMALAAVLDRFWPASYWIDMRSVHVDDAPYGTAPKMKEDRTIKRKFAASYDVETEVKRMTKPIGYTMLCKASGGPFDYAPDNVPPESLDLAWWVGNACKEGSSFTTIIDMKLLPIGTYRVETCRTIYPLRFFSPRRTCVTSNDFTIYP